LIWPSSEVPVPKGMTGTRSLAQMRTMSCTSLVVCGKTTASGGSLAIQVVVLACCSRTACEVTTRLPNFAASAATTALTALGSRREIRSDFSCTNAIANSRRAGMLAERRRQSTWRRRSATIGPPLQDHSRRNGIASVDRLFALLRPHSLTFQNVSIIRALLSYLSLHTFAIIRYDPNYQCGFEDRYAGGGEWHERND